MFQLQDSHNDFVHGASLRDIPVNKLAEQRIQKVSTAMVRCAISPSWKLLLLLIDRSVKIIQDYLLY